MPKRKMTKRALQAEETKNRIVRATMELMEKSGFSTLTIQEINEQAGVSVGTFYHYFKTKEDVFYELYRKADRYFEEVVEKRLYEKSMTTQERVVLYFSLYARFNHDNGLEYIRQLYNTNNKYFAAKGRYMTELLQKIVLEGMVSGDITRELSPEEITRQLFMLARGIVFDWCLHEGGYDLEQVMKAYMQRLVPTFKNK